MNNPPVLDLAGDVDGDGIPNGYELAHGLDPFNPADASLDSDGDVTRPLFSSQGLS
jgi:hypothetical protein